MNEPRPTHGYEFMSGIVQYTSIEGKFIPSLRCSVGGIPVETTLVENPDRIDELKSLVSRISQDLISKFMVECVYMNEGKDLIQCSHKEVTARQIHDIANLMEAGKLQAKVYATTHGDGSAVYEFHIKELPKPPA